MYIYIYVYYLSLYLCFYLNYLKFQMMNKHKYQTSVNVHALCSNTSVRL